MKVSKRDDYKRLIIFCLASIIVIAQTAAFTYVWYNYYRQLIFEPFWRKGNWVLIALYMMFNIMFSKLYGGLRVGYLKRMEI
ncbi:MAG: sugar transferase, partial [Blautia sp.]|nr:sugar transferase [Blautia sp.]